MATDWDAVPPAAVGLQLHRIAGTGERERLIACEEVYFEKGRDAVIRTLMIARIAGRMEIEGKIENHFADVLIDHDGSWDTTVALDAASYRALKTRWMRCKVMSQDGR